MRALSKQLKRLQQNPWATNDVLKVQLARISQEHILEASSSYTEPSSRSSTDTASTDFGSFQIIADDGLELPLQPEVLPNEITVAPLQEWEYQVLVSRFLDFGAIVEQNHWVGT